MENSMVMPLSEYEERMIAEFERQFTGEEPPELPPNLDARRVVQVGLVGVGAGFALMLASLSFSVLLSFAGFLVCFASAYWVSVGVRQGGWSQLVERYRTPVPRRRSTDL
jgi:Protein of unknown function (DUF3040)